MSDQHPERLIDWLKKISALAQSGVAGERANAQRMLDTLCKKHGVTPDQLADEKKDLHSFPCRDTLDEKLVLQVITYVCQTRKVRCVKQKKTWWFELTNAQAVDARECLDHYRKAWQAQLGDLMTAFMARNRIFAPPDGDPDTSPETAASQKIIQMMHMLDENRWNKRRLLE